jgi:mRNA interferase RelE/StbE
VKVEFRSSFAKDLKIVDKALAVRIQRVIEEVQRADSLSDVRNLKKLRGRENYYRVRIGDYRIGIASKATQSNL